VLSIYTVLHVPSECILNHAKKTRGGERIENPVNIYGGVTKILRFGVFFVRRNNSTAVSLTNADVMEGQPSLSPDSSFHRSSFLKCTSILITTSTLVSDASYSY
jgi:hypothetical protein